MFAGFSIRITKFVFACGYVSTGVLLQNILLNIRKKPYLTRVFVAQCHRVKKRAMHLSR